MRSRLAPIAVAVAAIVLLTGCSSSDTASLSGKEILARTKAAITAAKSYHVAGAMSGGLSGSVDLSVAGTNFAGSVNLGDDDLAFKLYIVVIDKDVWVKVPDEFLPDMLDAFGGDPKMVDQVRGKYIKGGDGSGGGLPFGDPDELRNIPQSLIPDGDVSKGEETTVNGTAVIALVYPDKSIVYVATKGEPYPVQVVDPDGNKISFDQFNSAQPVTAPPADSVLDESKLVLPSPTK